MLIQGITRKDVINADMLPKPIKSSGVLNVVWFKSDLNAAINIAHALKRGMGWGSSEPPNPCMKSLTQSQDGTGEAPCVSKGQFTLTLNFSVFRLFYFLCHLFLFQ